MSLFGVLDTGEAQVSVDDRICAAHDFRNIPVLSTASRAIEINKLQKQLVKFHEENGSKNSALAETLKQRLEARKIGSGALACAQTSEERRQYIRSELEEEMSALKVSPAAYRAKTARLEAIRGAQERLEKLRSLPDAKEQEEDQAKPRQSSPSRTLHKKKKQAVAPKPTKLTGVTSDAIRTAWERLHTKGKGHDIQAVLEELKAMGVVPSDTHLKQLEVALCAKRWWTPGKETTPHGSHPKHEWYESRHAAWLEAREVKEDEQIKAEAKDKEEHSVFDKTGGDRQQEETGKGDEDEPELQEVEGGWF